MSEQEAVSASLEDYLEVIHGLIQEHRVARSRDIARKMEVTGASVTGALRALAEKKLVNYAPYELVTLTERGRSLAEKVSGRHRALKQFFAAVLGLNDREAAENACRVEHAVSENLMQRLIRFAEFIRVCPRAGARWLEGFNRFCEDPACGRSQSECEQCMSGGSDGEGAGPQAKAEARE